MGGGGGGGGVKAAREQGPEEIVKPIQVYNNNSGKWK